MATSAEELTNCAVCSEFFTDPHVLPCDHVFCKGCVNRTKVAETIKCPNCSKVCVIDDVKPDFRLAKFLDAFAKHTEHFTKLLQPSTDSEEFTQEHVTPPADDKCESCEENVIDSFCHQCEQWFCKICAKAHRKMKASKDHTYTVLAEARQQLKTNLTKTVDILKQKTKEFNSDSETYDSIKEELQAAQKNAEQKSKALRKAFHEDIDKYFDTIDERIETFSGISSKTFNDQHHGGTDQLEACVVDITIYMDKLIAQNDRKLFAEGEQLLGKAKELLQSLTGASIDAVEIPQVRLERGQDWRLEGAVDLQLLPVQHNDHVCVFLIKVFIQSNSKKHSEMITNVAELYTYMCM